MDKYIYIYICTTKNNQVIIKQMNTFIHFLVPKDFSLQTHVTLMSLKYRNRYLFRVR